VCDVSVQSGYSVNFGVALASERASDTVDGLQDWMTAGHTAWHWPAPGIIRILDDRQLVDITGR